MHNAYQVYLKSISFVYQVYFPPNSRNIRLMVKNVRQQPDKESAQVLFERLESCRNQDNNPDSAAYKRKIEEMVDEDDLIGEDHIPIKQPKLDGVKVLSPGGG